jgi:hypothetical protein
VGGVRKLCFDHAIKYRMHEGKGKKPPKAKVTENKKIAMPAKRKIRLKGITPRGTCSAVLECNTF